METLDFLKSNISPDMPLLSIVDVFSRMCRISTDCEDEMFLFEAGIQRNEGKEAFQFSLARQFSDEKDEPTQLHLDITYNLTDKNKGVSTCSWHEYYGDFIQTVLLSKAFEICQNSNIIRIEIRIEET